MSLHKLPLFVWAIFVTAILLLLSLPVLAGKLIVPALNLAICWELSNSILNENNLTQSAGNPLDLDLWGILRDYTPEFICYKSMIFGTPQILGGKGLVNQGFLLITHTSSKTIHTKSNQLTKDFSSYLAGLIEGNGSIIVPTKERSDKGKINFPSIQIVFNLKDLPLALMIQKELKIGSLHKKKGVNAYVLIINNPKGQILLVNLINGYMKTPKLNALYLLIDWLNTTVKGLNIIKVPLNKEPLINNCWLSGFIDASGHFSIRTTTISKYSKIECKLELVQRQKDHKGKSTLAFLEMIAEFLHTNVKAIKINSLHPQFRVRTTSLKGNLALVNYLEKSPLFSSKHLDYKDWKKVLILIQKDEHKQKEEIEKIQNIKGQINDRRTDFT